MSITNGYATLAQLKARLGITGTSEDTLLEEAVQSASREIDKFCRRRFYKDTNATARVYDLNHDLGILDSCLAIVDDFWDTTGLIVKTDTGGDGSYATTWTTSDYQLAPLNGIVEGESGWPYWKIQAVRSLWFPSWPYRGVPLARRGPAPLQVTAKWGWTAVPDPVYQACLIIATANYKLKDAAFGAVGIGDLGVVTVTQVPAAMNKLKPYVRDAIPVA